MAKKTPDTTTSEQDFRSRCHDFLARRWEQVLSRQAEPSEPPSDPLHDRPDVIALIRACLTSKDQNNPLRSRL